MEEAEKGRICLVAMLLTPFISWVLVAKFLYGFTKENVREMLPLYVRETFNLWPLWGALLVGEILAVIGLVLFFKLNKQIFRGQKFKQIFRGTILISAAKLASLTRDKNEDQITIANIPVPVKAETTHISVGGATGVGKSTIFREIMFSCIKRSNNKKNFNKKDRMVILDPDGEFLSDFYKPGDKIMTPYDKRTVGWTFFNEIRADYDFERFSKSIVPKSSDSQTEEWNGYGRLLLTEVARKVFNTSRNPTMEEVFHWTNEVSLEELEAYVHGTKAQALFAGNSRATGSARFVLSNKLTPHLKMPHGDFSLRDWLNDPNGGNLFITWTEEMRDSLNPLISCWTDCVFSIVLGMQRDDNRRIWCYIDEVESLDYLPNMRDALTKGRKKGLRVVTGYQSFSQLVEIYGKNVAETLLGNHRTSVVMASGRLGEATLEFMSKSLGEIEGENEKAGVSRRWGQAGTKSINPEHRKARAVTATELAELPDLEGYLAFPSMKEVAKFKTDHVKYTRSTPVPGIVLRESTALGEM